MNCKSIQQKLIFIAENELAAQEAILVGQHLEHCQDCRMLYNELRETLGVITQEQSFQVNPFFATRVEQRLANLHEPVMSRYSIALGYARLVPVAISLVLAVWLGVNLGSGFTQQSAQQPTAQNSDTTSYYEEIFRADLLAGTLESVLMINGDKN